MELFHDSVYRQTFSTLVFTVQSQSLVIPRFTHAIPRPRSTNFRIHFSCPKLVHSAEAAGLEPKSSGLRNCNRGFNGGNRSTIYLFSPYMGDHACSIDKFTIRTKTQHASSPPKGEHRHTYLFYDRRKEARIQNHQYIR